ncbi:MAG: bifunctional 4-hydroxy-3-methylbut-2-enyl diphosphate reductase/30S ribosomal protein S1 [Faecalibacterium sp.]|nr:bifunctional 4-hydroxy-3-methylbut-2-enyl diphosphate reductase/30S ribosomal protein S1 [Ruminococcus sp.]MCM1393015.1 bifunctional 4-hydroxy-3-methylbut-2-enyl diphosphate reductase/30S ribosomal protein S1 [Ruminococcus sp.]MCM1486085.1 bifunctional 4-hydroxy-3-methylbut-2-enyl diphosphate reductase/30S ribosomal protein S1 [Faecalibacterium sp.]
MPVEKAKTAGFCFGVNRAVKMLYEMVENGDKVCTIGPIIHNPQVIDDLQSKGVRIIDDPVEAKKGEHIVIRTHGVTRQMLEKIKSLGIEYTDATCPYVMKIHNIIRENSTADNIVLIAGDESHPEVCGFRSQCSGESYVFKTAEDFDKLIEEHPEFHEKELIFVAQTTFSVEEWKKCSKKFKKLCTKSISFDTICKATQNRQIEAEKISSHCDAMIVVGGHFSSNTAKLKTVCEKNCPTYLVERAQELKQYDFSSCKSIGVTAGASTPAGIIKEVLFTMSEILNEQNSEDFDFAEALKENLDATMSMEPQVVGVVVGIAPNEIQVDIGRKYAGFVPIEEYSNDPTADPSAELKIGDKINLIIMKTNDNEGTMMLSKRRYDAIAAWDVISEAKESGETLEAVVAEAVKGGVLVYPKGIRVFIPGSLTGLARDAELSSLVKSTLRFRIIDVDKSKRRVVGSARAVIKDERKAASDAFWAQVEEGQEYTGEVKSLTSYGAFVDLGGVDGMIHISELSWKRIKRPSDVVNVGDTVKVYIKALDAENKKISLGYKRIEDNPWEILKRDYPVGTIVEAKVVGLTTFGAFANVIDGIDGLIHISQIADRHIVSPKDVLSIGDCVRVKITEIDFEKKRVSLSIRALIEDGEGINLDAAEETEEVEEAAEEATEEVATEE